MSCPSKHFYLVAWTLSSLTRKQITIYPQFKFDHSEDIKVFRRTTTKQYTNKNFRYRRWNTPMWHSRKKNIEELTKLHTTFINIHGKQRKDEFFCETIYLFEWIERFDFSFRSESLQFQWHEERKLRCL